MSWVARALSATVCVLAAASTAALPAASLHLPSHAQLSRGRACETADAERLPPYPWPLKPFYRQHQIRGYFGDPRTVVYAPRLGLFAFHNGVDISAWTGNKVYPVVSGVVVHAKPDEVVVRSPGGRTFQYIHVRRRVHQGEHVVASRTVLGNVSHPWEHVHLTELRGGCVVNPLAPGHLSPYRDVTVPSVASVSFTTASGGRLGPGDLHGFVEAVARAEDRPTPPVSGIWRRMPVAPALVRWSIRTRGGRRVAGGTVVDFRITEPPTQDFCRVYAPGTVQNFAADDGRFHWGQPGRYLFRLTATPFDTAGLANGRYRLTVVAADTAGNSGTRTVAIRIDNSGGAVVPPHRSLDWRCLPREGMDARVRAFRIRREQLAARHQGRAG
jgi:hypothetical protein